MRLFRHHTALPTDARGAVLALGNFDGVHRGHQAVIGMAGEIARRLRAPLGVLTFEPHPRQVFRPTDAPFRLTPFRIKARLIEALGVDLLVSLHFDRKFAALTAEAFVQTVLIDGLGVRHVVVGYDFVFGHGRAGTTQRLSEMAAVAGFGITTVSPVAADASEAGGEILSSTRVRDHLIAGKPPAAAALLGRPWEIDGRVEPGDQRGRTIGFPTANLSLDDYLRPASGVYAVRAGIEGPGGTVWHDAVANLGTRPTVDGTDLRLEVHLFDFAGDLYGRHLRVALVDYLRPEMKFSGLDALKAQIALDSTRAREILAAAKLPPG
ncbi:MAG TPA: bifunctional riboflavin kinase/FAD synthetase [Stellaceae bacterium]|nr:bifunctional riboflavin kinase/FAD synthetase [Stellaceae bacterium]